MRVFWAALAIAAAGFGAYANSFEVPFLFDDIEGIVRNPHVRGLRNVFGSPQDTATIGRPLVAFTLAVNYALGGYDVWGYHLFNVMVHVLAALALFGALRRTLLLDVWGGRYGGEAATELAFWTALLWAVHPLQTECVTYVSTRTESVMGLLYLSTLYAFIRALPVAGWSGWHTAAVAFCGLGMLAKQVMVTAPVLALLYDRSFTSGGFREALRLRGRLFAALGGSWVLLALATLSAVNPRSKVYGFWLPDMTSLDYLMTQLGCLAHYLRLAFLPWPQAIDYLDWPIAFTAKQILPGGYLVLALFAATILALRRSRRLGFLGAWFFLILAPTSSVLAMPAEPMAERRMYLPLAAVLCALVLGAWEALGRSDGPLKGRAFQVGLGASAACLATLAVSRNADYASELAIWRHDVSHRPANVRAWVNLGAALDRRERVAPLPPGRRGAIHSFRRALEVHPGTIMAHSNLGALLARRGEDEAALRHLRSALAGFPDLPHARANLGTLLLKMGRFREAFDHLQELVRLRPDQGDAHAAFGAACLGVGRRDLALEHYLQAVRLSPGNPLDHNTLGALLAERERWNEAAAEFREAIRLEPDLAEAHLNLSFVMAQWGAFEEAEREAREALRLSAGKDAGMGAHIVGGFDSLADRLSQNGRRPEAVRAARLAAAFARAFGEEARAEALEERARIYQADDVNE